MHSKIFLHRTRDLGPLYTWTESRDHDLKALENHTKANPGEIITKVLNFVIDGSLSLVSSKFRLD